MSHDILSYMSYMEKLDDQSRPNGQVGPGQCKSKLSTVGSCWWSILAGLMRKYQVDQLVHEEFSDHI